MFWYSKSPWLCDITNTIFWYHKNDFVISPNQPEFFVRILHILWYHKIDVLILKITLTLWYHKYDFMISKYRICDITKSWRFFGITFCFLYISQNRFFIQKIRFIFWYNKIDFVISKIDLVILNLILWHHKLVVLLCIQVSFRVLSISTFNCQKPKAQIYICICEIFRFQSQSYVQ